MRESRIQFTKLLFARATAALAVEATKPDTPLGKLIAAGEKVIPRDIIRKVVAAACEGKAPNDKQCRQLALVALGCTIAKPSTRRRHRTRSEPYNSHSYGYRMIQTRATRELLAVIRESGWFTPEQLAKLENIDEVLRRFQSGYSIEMCMEAFRDPPQDGPEEPGAPVANS